MATLILALCGVAVLIELLNPAPPDGESLEGGVIRAVIPCQVFFAVMTIAALLYLEWIGVL